MSTGELFGKRDWGSSNCWAYKAFLYSFTLKRCWRNLYHLVKGTGRVGRGGGEGIEKVLQKSKELDGNTKAMMKMGIQTRQRDTNNIAFVRLPFYDFQPSKTCFGKITRPFIYLFHDKLG